MDNKEVDSEAIPRPLASFGCLLTTRLLSTFQLSTGYFFRAPLAWGCRHWRIPFAFAGVLARAALGGLATALALALVLAFTGVLTLL